MCGVCSRSGIVLSLSCRCLVSARQGKQQHTDSEKQTKKRRKNERDKDKRDTNWVKEEKEQIRKSKVVIKKTSGSS